MSAAPVMILAGGTGGHIFPGLAVAQELRARAVPVVWLGSKAGLETKLVPDAGLPLETIDVTGLRGKGRAALLAAPLRLSRAGVQALSAVRRHRPRSVVSFGGFAAGPGGMAAWLLRRPLLVHEQNSVAGVTNRLLAKLARRVMGGFPDVLPKAEWVGNPVRADIAAVPSPALRFEGRNGPRRLLVLGGSQGAASLNAAVPRALAGIDCTDLDVRHQCGARHVDATRAAYAAAGIDARVDAFIADMADAYGWADLVVCRAGALTLAELAAAGCAAILVPFPAAVDDHQTRNAEFLVERGAAERVRDDASLAQALAPRLTELLGNRARLRAMAEAARCLARVDAAARVADACLVEARA